MMGRTWSMFLVLLFFCEDGCRGCSFDVFVGDAGVDWSVTDAAEGLDAQGEEEAAHDTVGDGDAAVDQLGDAPHADEESEAVLDAIDMDELEERIVHAWAISYGGEEGESASSIVQTEEGGYLVAGYSFSVSVHGVRFWLLKLNAYGDVLSQAAYFDTIGGLVRQTSDGGYIVAAVKRYAGYVLLLIKLDSNQSIVWQRGYEAIDMIFSLGETSSGGFGAGVRQAFGSNDTIMSIDANGDVIWERYVVAAGGRSTIYTFEPVPGGDFLVSGTISHSADREADVWVCRVSSAGYFTWCRFYDNLQYDQVRAMLLTPDGGAVLVGCSSVGHDGDMWAFKIGEEGYVVWEYSYTGEDDECAYAVGRTADGGFLVAGETRPVDGEFTDALVMRLDPDGNLLWQRTYGTERNDTIRSIAQSGDGGIIMAGGTDGSSWIEEDGDFWVLKTDSSGYISDTCPEEIGKEALLEMSSSSIAVTEGHMFGYPDSFNRTLDATVAIDTSAPATTQCRR